MFNFNYYYKLILNPDYCYDEIFLNFLNNLPEKFFKGDYFCGFHIKNLCFIFQEELSYSKNEFYELDVVMHKIYEQYGIVVVYINHKKEFKLMSVKEIEEYIETERLEIEQIKWLAKNKKRKSLLEK